MSPERRLSRPVYEALPWLYILCGLAGLTASYLTSGLTSAALGIPGLIATLGGFVLVLRRRDFRKMRASYGDPESSVLPKGED